MFILLVKRELDCLRSRGGQSTSKVAFSLVQNIIYLVEYKVAYIHRLGLGLKGMGFNKKGLVDLVSRLNYICDIPIHENHDIQKKQTL